MLVRHPVRRTRGCAAHRRMRSSHSRRSRSDLHTVPDTCPSSSDHPRRGRTPVGPVASRKGRTSLRVRRAPRSTKTTERGPPPDVAAERAPAERVAVQRRRTPHARANGARPREPRRSACSSVRTPPHGSGPRSAPSQSRSQSSILTSVREGRSKTKPRMCRSAPDSCAVEHTSGRCALKEGVTTREEPGQPDQVASSRPLHGHAFRRYIRTASTRR